MNRKMEEKIRKGFAEEDCGGEMLDLLVTADLLDEAGIDPADTIEIFCKEGAVIIRQRSILDRLPDELRERFDATGLSEETLEAALRMEAEKKGSVDELLKTLGSEPF